MPGLAISRRPCAGPPPLPEHRPRRAPAPAWPFRPAHRFDQKGAGRPLRTPDAPHSRSPDAASPRFPPDSCAWVSPARRPVDVTTSEPAPLASETAGLAGGGAAHPGDRATSPADALERLAVHAAFCTHRRWASDRKRSRSMLTGLRHPRRPGAPGGPAAPLHRGAAAYVPGTRYPVMVPVQLCTTRVPFGRNAQPSRSPPTNRSPRGQRPSPTRGSAPPSSTA